MARLCSQVKRVVLQHRNNGVRQFRLTQKVTFGQPLEVFQRDMLAALFLEQGCHHRRHGLCRLGVKEQQT